MSDESINQFLLLAGMMPLPDCFSHIITSYVEKSIY